MKIMPKQFDMACARAKHVLTTAVAGKMYSTILPADSLYNLAKVERVSIEVISRHYSIIDDCHSLVYIIK